MSRRAVDGPLLEPLAGLLGEPPGATRSIRFEDVRIPIADDLALAGPISGRGHVARTNRGLLLELEASATIAATCARCLEPLDVPLTVRVEEEVMPSIDLATGSPLDTAVEPEVVRLDDHHGLDLEPLLREAILLAEPIAPLCRPDCPGLCSGCGERLDDISAHEHGDDAIDPRLEVLRRFAVDGRDENG